MVTPLWPHRPGKRCPSQDCPRGKQVAETVLVSTFLKEEDSAHIDLHVLVQAIAQN